MNLEARIGRLLWDMGRVEGTAVSAFALLEESPCLTRAEQAPLLCFQRQETRHANITRAWAARLCPAAPRLAPFAALARRDVCAATRLLEPARTVQIVAAVHWNERNTLRQYPRWIEVFRRLGLGALAEDFSGILDEERAHVAWGRSVLRRWSEHSPAMNRAARIALGLAGRVYAAAIAVEHRAVWEDACATVGLARRVV